MTKREKDRVSALKKEVIRRIMELTDEQANIVFAAIQMHNQHPDFGVEECFEIVEKERG